jgi:hypothetical protein
MRCKYPKTPHLPWSPGLKNDDTLLKDTSVFEGKRVIVTEKMDGENTTMYRDGFHARSLDSRHHASRDWVKALHGSIKHLIPENWRLCGENLYAQHSIRYEELPSYFMLFSIWDAYNHALHWDDTVAWANDVLHLCTVPVLYDGIYDAQEIKSAWASTLGDSEGYVVRLAGAIPYSAFSQSVAKYVRKNHIQTDEHWMSKPVVPNQLQQHP